MISENTGKQTYHAPIPLGGIAIKRSTAAEIQTAVERIIKKSIQFAFENPQSSSEFVQQHSQEMSEAVCRQHIELYVNKYSVELGTEGEAAVKVLYKIAREKNIIPEMNKPVFIE